jgi:hypothetical protein
VESLLYQNKHWSGIIEIEQKNKDERRNDCSDLQNTSRQIISNKVENTEIGSNLFYQPLIPTTIYIFG